MKIYLSILLLTCSFLVVSQITLIPDVNFEQELINQNIDTDGVINGQVLTADIENILILNLNYKDIDTLEGIEDFNALEELNCYGNNLYELDVSQNVNLEKLNFTRNHLSNINLTNNTNLKELFCDEWDGDVFWNSFNEEGLDLSTNILLEKLYCSSLGLSELDLTNNVNLKILDCSSNDFIELDLSNNVVLEELYANYEAFDPFYEGTGILETLYINNGNNINLTVFTAINNPNLTCIFVDDVDYSNGNWSLIDDTSHFVENQAQCDAIVSVEDNIIEINFSFYPNLQIVCYILIAN